MEVAVPFRFKHLILPLAAALLLAGLTACQPEEEPVTLRIGWTGSPDTLNPGMGELVQATTIYELVYDAMFKLQPGGNYTPELADSFQVSGDGTVWTITLREDVTWHDGRPLTARDVAFTYNFYQSHSDLFPYVPLYTAYFESVEAPDDRTVVITLTEAIPNMEYQLTYLYVLPEHIWAEVEDPGTFENAEMIGSGPFQLAEYVPGETVRLAANPDHYLYQPEIDEIIFITYPEPDSMADALIAGEVDLITTIPSDRLEELAGQPGVEVVTGSPLIPYVNDIVFNLADPDACPEGGVCSGHPALRDRAVRLALAHATDKATIVREVAQGLGTPGLTLIPAALTYWYNDTLTDYAFDLDEANRILDEAGYADADGDGVRETSDGLPLRFRLQWPDDNDIGADIAGHVAATWAQIGVEALPEEVPVDRLVEACCPTYDYDILLWGWGSDPDPGFLLSVMTSEQIPSGLNESGYSNPEMDALYAQQATAMSLEARRDLVYRMQALAHQDVIYIIPYYGLEAQAYRSDRFIGWITDSSTLALTDLTSLVRIGPVE